MTPIDYVVTYVDNKDPNWQELYRTHASRLSSEDRYRDNGTLLYQLRGVEKFMPWLNRIFLIVQSPSQIPKWLNVNHPKLRIVYHDEYIPSEYLPTFKSTNIELNIYRIKDLSNNFILANDDMIPIRPQPIENYFKDDKPVQPLILQPEPLEPSDDRIYFFKLYRLMILERMYIKDKNFPGLQHFHLLIPYNKEFWSKIMDRFDYTFKVSFSDTSARTFVDMVHWIISDLQVLSGFSIVNNSLNIEGYLEVYDNTTEEEFNSVFKIADTVCLNDSVENNLLNLKRMTQYLDKVLPEKSSFEL